MKEVTKKKRTREVFNKIFPQPFHVHPAYFGSELACPICNPNCYEKHGIGLPIFCGDKECPMSPKNLRNIRKNLNG